MVKSNRDQVINALLTLDDVLKTDGDVKCEPIDVCSERRCDLVDEHCTSAPWQRPRDGQLCMFDSVLIANGMHRVIINSERRG